MEFEIKKSDLDKRICDVVEGASNTQTYREFLDMCSLEFYNKTFDWDSMNEEELNHWLGFLDYLCGK